MAQAGDDAQVEVTIRGRVQGVYFRASALSEAQQLGLTGWVMNCADGSVKLVAEGSREKLDQLIVWCRQGPRGARVSEVEVQWNTAQNNFTGFAIRR